MIPFGLNTYDTSYNHVWRSFQLTVVVRLNSYGNHGRQAITVSDLVVEIKCGEEATFRHR